MADLISVTHKIEFNSIEDLSSQVCQGEDALQIGLDQNK